MKQILALLLIAVFSASGAFAGGHSCCKSSAATTNTSASAGNCMMDKAECKRLMKDANCAEKSASCKDKADCPSHGARQAKVQAKKARPSKLTMKAGS